MKVIKKIKKGLIGIGAFLLTISTKVLAVGHLEELQPQPAYGIPNPEPVRNIWVSSIWNICRIFVIPIALIIGIAIYLKKSKSSTKKKILVTIGIIAITVILYFIVDKIIYELA